MQGVRSIALIALWCIVAFVLDPRTSVASTTVRVVARQTGIGLSVDDDGSFAITTRIPGWTFSGNVGSPVANLASRLGRDLAGRYREVEFKYATSGGAGRLGAIRVYDDRPVVVFTATFLTAGKTSE